MADKDDQIEENQIQRLRNILPGVGNAQGQPIRRNLGDKGKPQAGRTGSFSGTDGDDEIFGDDIPRTRRGKERAIFGGDGDDFINGEGGDDLIFGGNGDDTLVGGEGDDRLVGGAGRDVLEGGQGADEFRFNAEIDQGTTDEIVDFLPEEGDTVVFDGEGDVTFTLGEGGHLMATFTTAASEGQESVSVSVDLGDVEQEGLQVERNFEGNTTISLNTGFDR